MNIWLYSWEGDYTKIKAKIDCGNWLIIMWLVWVTEDVSIVTMPGIQWLYPVYNIYPVWIKSSVILVVNHHIFYRASWFYAISQNKAPCSMLHSLKNCYAIKELIVLYFVIKELFYNSVITLPCISKEALFRLVLGNISTFWIYCDIELHNISYQDKEMKC